MISWAQKAKPTGASSLDEVCACACVRVPAMPWEGSSRERRLKSFELFLHAFMVPLSLLQVHARVCAVQCRNRTVWNQHQLILN